MDKNQMYVEVINSKTGKIFALPTLYTDRTEACVCGQNYCRDRYVEDETVLFFRVVKTEELHPTDERSEEDEKPSVSLPELLSVFNAVRPNY